MLNLPAILELSLPDSGQRRFARAGGFRRARTSIVRFGEMGTMLDAAATSIASGSGTRTSSGATSRISRRGSCRAVAVAEVKRLQQLLATRGCLSGPPSLTYDTATTEAIARFQRSHRLVPDGIVGPLTKIVLYGALADYQHPRLSGGT